MRFPKLVDGSIEDGHCKDESPICKVDEKSGRVPDWTRELYASRSQRGEEIFQVKPKFKRGKRVKVMLIVTNRLLRRWNWILNGTTLSRGEICWLQIEKVSMYKATWKFLPGPCNVEMQHYCCLFCSWSPNSPEIHPNQSSSISCLCLPHLAQGCYRLQPPHQEG